MSFELGGFSFTYKSMAVHGVGISASSNFAVLYRASQLFLKDGAPLIPDEVARDALEFERRLANPFEDVILTPAELASRVAKRLYLAADDVYPIVHGGVVKVHTVPPTTTDPSKVTVEPVHYDPRWIANHLVLAFNPYGRRHDVPELFAEMTKNPATAKGYVRDMSTLAEQAAAAITSEDPKGLAESVSEYKRLFNQWVPDGKYINSGVRNLIDSIPAHVLNGILGWKPPGAGASEAVMLITRDRDARDVVMDWFANSDSKWWHSPAYVTAGLCTEFIKSDGTIRITAGHRFDFVGAADLGQSPIIDMPGICCSCAIEPRGEIILTGTTLKQ